MLDRPTGERRRTRRTGARLDPAGPALALLAVIVYWLNGFDGYLSRDLALYAYAGQQVAEGDSPYVGVVNRSGPLSHAVPGLGALLARLLGTDDLLTMRVLFLVLSAGCIWLAYLLGRDLLQSRPAGLATAAALLAVHGFALYATHGPREKTTLVLFLIAAFVAMARHRPAWAGAFVALATLTWQPSFFVGAAAGVVGVVALSSGERVRALLRFGVGGLVPLAVCLVWYAAIGELQVFLDCFALIHVQYTDQPGIGTDWEAVEEMLNDAYGRFLWSMVAGAVALLVAAVAVLVRPTRRTPEGWLVVAMAAGLVAGLLWSLKAFNGFPDIFFVLPATILGIGVVTREVQRWAGDRAAVAVAVAWSLVAAGAALQYTVTTRDDILEIQRRETAAVLEALPADATIVSIEAPHPLVLAGATNPYPHQMFSLGLEDYVDDTWPGGLAGLAEDIAERRPTVIAVGTIDPEWLEPTLADGYVEVGSTVGWHWWVDESVGAETLAAVARATAGGEADPQAAGPARRTSSLSP
ncbi:hypothetical protein ACFP3Q_15745 [Nocardioides sp. GCM10027113]|uniref:hypothetical protein n=1 Tax=unclassified Nocardioides TaxID=2615069 RepID=UPI0036077225